MISLILRCISINIMDKHSTSSLITNCTRLLVEDPTFDVDFTVRMKFNDINTHQKGRLLCTSTRPRPKIGPSQHVEAKLMSNIPNDSSGPEDFRSASNFLARGRKMA